MGFAGAAVANAGGVGKLSDSLVTGQEDWKVAAPGVERRVSQVTPVQKKKKRLAHGGHDCGDFQGGLTRGKNTGKRARKEQIVGLNLRKGPEGDR